MATDSSLAAARDTPTVSRMARLPRCWTSGGMSSRVVLWINSIAASGGPHSVPPPQGWRQGVEIGALSGMGDLGSRRYAHSAAMGDLRSVFVCGVFGFVFCLVGFGSAMEGPGLSFRGREASLVQPCVPVVSWQTSEGFVARRASLPPVFQSWLDPLGGVGSTFSRCRRWVNGGLRRERRRRFFQGP